MKKNRVLLCTLVISLGLSFQRQKPLTITAQSDVVAPFIVTQSINQEVIDRDQCYALIRSHTTAADTSSEESQVILADIDLLQANMEATNLNYQMLNEEISLLEYGEVDSLIFANQQLENVVELLYVDYVENDSEFQLLTEEEQLQQISQHEVVIEWQTYTSQLQQLINEKVVARDEQETIYYQLVYELENQSRLLEEEKWNQSQLNQCLLYPYSTAYQAVDSLLLNSQVENLDNYLLEVDSFLQKIVPNAFRKIAYYDVYRFFTLPTNDETQTIEMLNNKETTLVDESGLEKYSYATELNLYDLEVLGNYAKSAYLKQPNIDSLTERYIEALNLKEAQFTYFYSLNREVFTELASQLANYLNAHQLTDSSSLEKIQTLHNRYQIKLIFLDDASLTWSSNDTESSGYYSLYRPLSLTQVQAVDSKTGNPIESGEVPVSDVSSELSLEQPSDSKSSLPFDLSAPDETTSTPINSDGLDYLKDKLTNGQNTYSNVKPSDLPKPSDLSKNSSLAKPKAISSKLTLPNTGETAIWTLVASVLLIVGLILLLVNQIIKRKRRENLEKIKLD